MSSIVENWAYSPSRNVENEENPGITRFFQWKTTRKTVKHVLEKCFPASRKPLCKNFKKQLWTGLFHVFANFSSMNSKLALDFSGKRTNCRVFPFSPPCFPVSQAVFSRFSALVSNHFHRFPHSLNKKWKTRKTWGWWLWKFPPWVERVLKNMTFHL